MNDRYEHLLERSGVEWIVMIPQVARQLAEEE